MFWSSLNWRADELHAERDVRVLRDSSRTTCSEPRCFGTCARYLPTSPALATPPSVTFA